MEHLIHLKGYKASHDEGGILKLGTKDSFGIETLKIDADEAWDGLIISATFVTSAGRTKMTMKPDNTIVVPPEATAADTRMTINRIVFSGIKTQVQRITTDLPYEVDPHAPIDGDNSTPRTPDEYIQFVEQMKEEVRKANPVPDPGTGNDGKVPTVRGDKYVLETPQGGGGSFDINTATPTFTEADTRENIETGETIPTLFGKIKKFFSDLKTIAFTGNYSDLTGQPQALKNPNALTFTGGATGTYDGSSPVEIAIPQGGGGGINPVILFDTGVMDEEANLIGPIDISKHNHIRIVGEAFPSENSAGKSASMLCFEKDIRKKLLTSAGNGKLFDTQGNPVCFVVYLDKGQNLYTTHSYSGYNSNKVFDSDASDGTSSKASTSDGSCAIYRTSAFDETQMYICAADDLVSRPWGIGTRIMVIGE